MPVFEFACTKCGKPDEKFFTSFSRYELEENEFLSGLNEENECLETTLERIEHCDFSKVLSVPCSTVFDGAKFGFASKGVDGDFKSAMRSLKKRNEPKTYGKVTFGQKIFVKDYNLGAV